MSKMGSFEPFGYLQHKLCQNERPGIKLAVWFPTIKSWESTRPDPSACRGSVTCCWKACDESYKFALDFIPIGGLNKKLWPRKMTRVQTKTVSELLLGSPRVKSHWDVGVVERHRKYYKGEGGGFPLV
jgi:hypothetical protein